jgi:hypothetical protein
VHRAQRPPGGDPAEDRREGNDHGQREQRVLQQVRQGEGLLGSRALLREVRGALDHALGQARPCRELARGAVGKGRLLAVYLALPQRPKPGHQDVADRHDDRPAHGEQAGVQQGQPCPDGQPRAVAHIRYPLPTTVSISGGSPSLRRSRVIVTER